MMNSKCLIDGKEELQKEFSEFLIKIIKDAGGSLPFHQLYNFLHHARFEIRNAFGTNKSDLMKFLKAHAKIFLTNPVGMVTITASSVFDDDSYDEDDDTCKSTQSKKTSVTKIESGTGIVIKLHTDFGIIKAVEPLETEVYFKSEAFTGNKDSLLTDSCLEIGHEVYFNAVYGHDDYDIKFRASKVWIKFDRNVDSEENIDVGDHITFSARSDKRDSKGQGQATDVRKKSKDNVQSSSHTKMKPLVQNRIENVQGKIFPYSQGAIIKFGTDYSELADGDSSNYFLYGSEVSEIVFEFSEGDDVLFDAIKTKSAPGWKAVLVWVGEKPACVNNKISAEEEKSEFSAKSCALSTDIAAVRFLRSKTIKSQNEASVTEHVMQSKSKLFDHSSSRKNSQPDLDHKKQNCKSSKSLQSFSAKKSMNKKGGIQHGKANSLTNRNKCNQHRTAIEREVMHVPNLKTSSINKQIDTRCQSSTEFDDISIHCDKEFEDHLSCKDDVSDISEGSFHDGEFQDILHSDENLLKERYDNTFASASRYNFGNCDKEDIDNTCNETKCCQSADKKRPSIKKFEDIDGEIIYLYCKAAIVNSSQLQKNVDFVLNVFYINGKSVEEQQVIDLKEIIKVGDHVNFNCFEIIDDSGEIHLKVTMAWKGPKPNVYEMTPKEFIDEYELSVTINDESLLECLPDQRIPSENSLAQVLNSEETVNNYDPMVFLSDSPSEDMSDAEMLQELTCAETQILNPEEEDLLLGVHHKLLSDMIVHRLKSKGVISADLQVDFSGVLTEIIRETQNFSNLSGYQNYSVNEEAEQKFKEVSHPVCFTCSEKKGSVFSGKNKSDKHAAVQTIITGGIVAQSIYTQS